LKQFPPPSIPKPPNPSEADKLVWDSALGKWVAKAVNGGGDLDGGFANSTYTADQISDGGDANG